MVVAICVYEHNEEAESLLLTPFSAPIESSVKPCDSLIGATASLSLLLLSGNKILYCCCSLLLLFTGTGSHLGEHWPYRCGCCCYGCCCIVVVVVVLIVVGVLVYCCLLLLLFFQFICALFVLLVFIWRIILLILPVAPDIFDYRSCPASSTEPQIGT